MSLYPSAFDLFPPHLIKKSPKIEKEFSPPSLPILTLQKLKTLNSSSEGSKRSQHIKNSLKFYTLTKHPIKPKGVIITVKERLGTPVHC